MALNPENLTYWYLRLNGFFTIPNFVIHPDLGQNQRTDVDVFGIRLPHRAELLVNPMVDDPLFRSIGVRSFIAIAEVKNGLITLNQTWTSRDKMNVQRFLRAAGPFETERVDAIADEIYQNGFFTADNRYHVSFLAVGGQLNPDLREQYPAVPQITWEHICDFIYNRFYEYYVQKKSHGQWDVPGQELWNLAREAHDPQEFRAAVLQAL